MAGVCAETDSSPLSPLPAPPALSAVSCPQAASRKCSLADNRPAHERRDLRPWSGSSRWVPSRAALGQNLEERVSLGRQEARMGTASRPRNSPAFCTHIQAFNKYLRSTALCRHHAKCCKYSHDQDSSPGFSFFSFTQNNTVLKEYSLWHYVHSQCRATITTIHVQSSSIYSPGCVHLHPGGLHPAS